jgi:acetyl-CoA carboxylase beta subunit
MNAKNLYILSLKMIFRLSAAALFIFVLNGNSFSQWEKIIKKHQPLKIQKNNNSVLNNFSQKKKAVNGKQNVALQRMNGPFSQTPQNDFTQKEIDIMNEMDKLKQNEN